MSSLQHIGGKVQRLYLQIHFEWPITSSERDLRFNVSGRSDFKTNFNRSKLTLTDFPS